MPGQHVQMLRSHSPFVVVADCDRRVRQALRALLEADSQSLLVAEAADSRDLRRLQRELQPDVVILGLQFPTTSDGLCAIRHLATPPGTPVVVLSIDGAGCEEALATGAACVLEKGLDADLLLHTIKGTLRSNSRPRG